MVARNRPGHATQGNSVQPQHTKEPDFLSSPHGRTGRPRNHANGQPWRKGKAWGRRQRYEYSSMGTAHMRTCEPLPCPRATLPNVPSLQMDDEDKGCPIKPHGGLIDASGSWGVAPDSFGS